MYSEWRDGLERWPRALPEFEFEPKTTALMIVDLQHYDAHRDYGLAKTLLEKFPDMYEYYYNRIECSVVPNTVKLLRYFRENNLRVIHVTVGPELPDGSDFYTPRRAKDLEKQKAPGARTLFCKGSFEHSILSALAPLENELVINKTSSSAFSSTGVDNVLRKLRIDSLVITGALTNSCVGATALDAADRWYKTVIVEDATGTLTEEAHYSTLRNFARLYGLVLETDGVIQRLEACKQV